MKKNVLAMGLALTMALGLTACGGTSPPGEALGPAQHRKRLPLRGAGREAD